MGPLLEWSEEMKMRLQILTSIILLSAIAGFALFLGYVEVATGCTGGVIALGMKLLESE